MHVQELVLINHKSIIEESWGKVGNSCKENSDSGLFQEVNRN